MIYGNDYEYSIIVWLYCRYTFAGCHARRAWQREAGQLSSGYNYLRNIIWYAPNDDVTPGNWTIFSVFRSVSLVTEWYGGSDSVNGKICGIAQWIMVKPENHPKSLALRTSHKTSRRANLSSYATFALTLSQIASTWVIQNAAYLLQFMHAASSYRS